MAANPVNLLVSSTRQEARRILEAFRLSERIWQPIGLDEGLVGARFDRIVVQMPDEVTIHVKDRIQHIGLRLAPGGQFIII
jgi:hypothetical protein